MRKIIITGAGGYIGSVACDLFLKKGFNIVALDNFSRGFKSPLEFLKKKYGEDRLKVYEIDLAEDDIGAVFEAEQNIEAVVHYGALCSVNESVLHPELYEKNNVIGSQRLIKAIKQAGVDKIIFSSTCAVYGNAKEMSITEDASTLPVNPYGESKLKIEEEIKNSGLIYVILRYFNVCGATDEGDIGDSKKPSVHLMQNAVRGVLGIEPFFLTCPTVDTPDHTPIRDYVNVVDLNEAHLLALLYLFAGGESEVINLGTGTGNSVLSIIKQVEEITGAIIEKKTTQARVGEYPRAVADIKKAGSILKWQPKRSLSDSVNSLVKWYTSHPHGWDS